MEEALPIDTDNGLPEKPGLRSFTFLLVGQTISLLGNSLTSFGLGVWAYQKTGAVTDFAMIALAASLPAAFISPLAGTMVDRFNRKAVLLIGQTSAVVLTASLMILYWLEFLQVWHIVLITGLAAVFNAFVLPAVTASITMLVHTHELPKANGMLSLALGVVQLLAPAIAGALLLSIGLKGIFLINLTTFFFGIVALIITPIPQPPHVSDNKESKDNLIKSMSFGWNHVRQRKGMVGLLSLHAALAFNIAAIGMLMTPMVLGFTDAAGLGMIASISGLGMVLGSILIMAWGGPDRKIFGVSGGAMVVCIGLILMPIQPSVAFVALGGLLIMVAFPVSTACNQEIFQRKIASDVQGRVFGLRAFICGITAPLAIVLAGPLADGFFEPNMLPDGVWAESLGLIYGTGPGRGVAVMISSMGIISSFVVLAAMASPNIRRIDLTLPDLNQPSTPTDNSRVQVENS